MKLSTTHQNLIHQAIGQGLGKSITLLYTLLLPRFLGLNSYGKFSFFYSICIITIQPVIELGLDLILVKSVSRGNLKAVSDTLALKGISSLLCGGVIGVLTVIFGWPPFIIFSLYLYIVMASIQRTCFAYLRGLETMRLESWVVPTERGLCILFAVLLSLYQVNPDWIAPGSLLFSSLIATVWVLYRCRHWLIEAISSPPLPLRLLNQFREGMYLAGVSILGLIYFRVDSIMLGMMADLNEVANYNAAFRLIEGLIYFPSVLMAVYFPKLVKSQQEFSIYFIKLLGSLTVMGLFLTSALFSLSPLIIGMIYGTEWEASVPILRCLSFSLFPICLGHLTTQSLVINNWQKPYFWMVLLTTLENILLNLMLIPNHGSLGASIATCLTELSITSLCFCWLYSKGAIVLPKLDVIK